MNQILITGEEQETTRKTIQKTKKQKQLLPINGIVVFYAMSIIILGICMISGSVYAREKINETVEANKKPEITLTTNNDNTITIIATHIRNIKTVTYRWNEEEEKTIESEEGKNITATIPVMGGENVLTVIATEENGQSTKIEKTYTSTIPRITIESIENGVQVTTTSDEIIDYVQYSWDNGEMQRIEVGEESYEGIINVLQGEHTLRIEAVNMIGETATEERTVVGDTEPTLNIKSELINGVATFVIDAEDDISITTIEIIHNGGEKQTIDVNARTYHGEIVMTEGERNTIIVRATNASGLTRTRGIRFDNIQ